MFGRHRSNPCSMEKSKAVGRAALGAAAIGAVAAGFVVLQPEDLDGLLVHPRPAAVAEPLTPREIEVLGMLAEGQSNYQHVTSIMSKLNAGSRTEAVTLGIRQGLIML